MSKGVVKFFDRFKGFGFIYDDDGMDVFFHYSDIRGSGFQAPDTGSVVEYTLHVSHTGKRKAKDVRVLYSPIGRELIPERAELEFESEEMIQQKVNILTERLNLIIAAERVKQQD